MKINSLVLSLIILASFLILPRIVSAADCTTICKYSNDRTMDLAGGNETCTSLYGNPVISATANGNNINVNVKNAFTTVEGASRLCVVMDLGGNVDSNYTVQDPISQCKVINLDDDSGASLTDVIFSPESGVNHHIAVFADARLKGGACGNGNVPVTLINSTLPTSTPIPTPRSDCADLNASCIGAGFVSEQNCPDADISEGVGAGCLPICSGLTCAITDFGSGSGIVTVKSNSNISDIRNLIDVSKLECGAQGLQCCTPNILGQFPSMDNIVPEGYGLRTMFKFFSGWVMPWFDSMNQSTSADIYKSTDSRLCTGELRPQIVYNSNYYEPSQYQTPDVIENKFDLENNSYFRFQCPTSGQVGDCKDVRIPYDKVSSCTCVSPDGDNAIERVKADPTIDVESQICTINGGIDSNCKSCLNDENMYWTIEGTCKDKDTATILLQQMYDVEKEDTQTGNPDVKGVMNTMVSDVQSYLHTTCEDGDKGCEACLLSGKFFGRVGCTEYHVSTAHFKNLCKNVEDNEVNACRACGAQGKMWTAIGCIDLNLETFIKDEIFGWGMGLAGTATLLCIIYSAFLMQTATNNPEKISHAQEMMTSCITGLIVIIFSVFILNVIGVDILRIPGFTSYTTDGKCTYIGDTDCEPTNTPIPTSIPTPAG